MMRNHPIIFGKKSSEYMHNARGGLFHDLECTSDLVIGSCFVGKEGVNDNES